MQAVKRVGMTFQFLCGGQMFSLDTPANRSWVDHENRIVRREMAAGRELARDMAESLLPELGVDPEPPRVAESEPKAGRTQAGDKNTGSWINF